MTRATFDLPDETVASLEALAAEQGSSPSVLIDIAVRDLLRKRRLSDEEWLTKWRALQEDVALRIPTGLSSEDLEAEIDTATDEVWAERRAARRR